MEWEGQRRPLSERVQDLYDYVAIMDYRNFAEGADSITSHAEDELAYGDRIGRPVMIGVETLKTTPAKVTFFGKNQQGLGGAARPRPGLDDAAQVVWRLGDSPSRLVPRVVGNAAGRLIAQSVLGLCHQGPSPTTVDKRTPSHRRSPSHSLVPRRGVISLSTDP